MRVIPQGRRAVFALFIAYLAAVAAITLGPAPAPDETLGVVRAAVTWLNAHGVGVSYEGVEFAANVVMFVPFGVFVGRLWPDVPWWQVIALGFGTSLVIECTQRTFLPTRIPDVRDLLANTAGVALGLIESSLVYRRVNGEPPPEPVMPRPRSRN